MKRLRKNAATTSGSVLWRGVVAGLAGALAMQMFRSAWRAGTHHKPELDIFGLDRESDVNSMQLLAKAVLRKELQERHAEQLATAFHYAYGAAAGALYGMAAAKTPVIRSGFGTLYGAAVWIFGDEIPITAAGVSDRSRKAAASHTAALFAHLLYGTVTDLVLRNESRRFR